MKPIYEPKGKAKEYGDYAINIYTGCPHRCYYCVSGETLVLMADGTSKKIKDIDIGDKVYGVERVGNYQRYVVTDVLNKMRSVKPSVKIVLADGTEITSSEDHRFLAQRRGWKYAIGSMGGENQRPYLTTNDSLLGGGKTVSNVTLPETPDYRWGYLSGAIKGDGTVGHYAYGKSQVHSMRVSVKDAQIVDRVTEYLEYFGFSAFKHFHNCGSGQVLASVRNSRRKEIEEIEKGISFKHTAEFMRGFIAGIYDTEGCSGGLCRIANTDLEILHFLEECLDVFEFDHVFEDRKGGKNKNVSSVRVTGGIHEKIRLLQISGCVCKRKFSIEGRSIKNDIDLQVLSVSKTGRNEEMYDITTGTGNFIANGIVAHNCFAPTVLRKDRETFHSHVEPRANIVEEVRKQLERENITGKLIHLCFTCDPYPTGYDTTSTREIIKLIKEHGNHVQILTKGDGSRDFDLLDGNDWYGITLDGSGLLPADGVSALYAAKRCGINTWISFEPVVNSANVLDLIRLCGQSKCADKVKIGKLNYYPSDIDWKSFGKQVEALCQRCGLDYYIKESLRAEMEKGGGAGC